MVELASEWVFRVCEFDWISRCGLGVDFFIFIKIEALLFEVIFYNII